MMSKLEKYRTGIVYKVLQQQKLNPNHLDVHTCPGFEMSPIILQVKSIQ